MWMNWSAAAGLAALAVAYVLYAHVQAHSRAWAAWTLRLSHSREAFLEWLRRNTAGHLAMLADTLRFARAQHHEGHDVQALRVLGEAEKLAVLHVRLLRRWLQIWTDVMDLMQISPAAPTTMMMMMTAAPAGQPPLRGLRWAGRLGDALLPTQASRFRLSVRLQRAALRCVAWDAGAAHLRARQPGRIGPALETLESNRTVLAALDDQALATLECLLQAFPPGGHKLDGGRAADAAPTRAVSVLDAARLERRRTQPD